MQKTASSARGGCAMPTMKKTRAKSSRKVINKNRESKKTMEDLLSIMATLRSPWGCPWDRKQTRQTLKPYLIEEAYEALEAIESGTPEAVKEELGDILLQIIFQSRIAEERGEFSFGNVVHTLAEKLVRRHPHVFPAGEDDSAAIHVKNAKDVTEVWRKIKENEGKCARRTSALDGIPLALPALERARRMSQRASAAGFDWPDAREVLANVEDRLAELRKTRQKASGKATEEALGDLLFLLVHWAFLERDVCRGSPSQGQPPLSKPVPEVRERALPERKSLQNDFSWANQFSLNCHDGYVTHEP